MNKCSRKTGTYARTSDELCGDKEDCCLSAWQGRWICCQCKFGYRPGEVNRLVNCIAGRCGHEVCWGCFARTDENIRNIYAECASDNSEEIEEAAGEDISMDSIVFYESDGDEDE